MAVLLYGHGDHRPGPHGGEIRMPGVFHTELVAINSRQYKVYLLDMKFADATTQDSHVKVSYEGKRAKCEKAEDHFKCTFKRSLKKKKGEILIEATRKGKRGKAIYAMPLKFSH